MPIFLDLNRALAQPCTGEQHLLLAPQSAFADRSFGNKIKTGSSGMPEGLGGHTSMYATRGEAANHEVRPERNRHEMTVGWVVKRALLGMALIAALMGSFAWLTYSSLPAEGPNALTTSSVQRADGR